MSHRSLAWLLVLLVACSKKKEEPRVPPPEPIPAPVTPLERAQRQLTPELKPSPSALVALAFAQVVAKQPVPANATLKRALAVARSDDSRGGAEALVEAVEVMLALSDSTGAAKLLDEAMARLERTGASDQLPAILLAPNRIQEPSVIDRLATLVAARVPTSTDLIEVSSPAWYAVVAKVQEGPKDVRAWTLARLAAIARHAGKTVVAVQLAREAAKLALETPSAWAIDIARELALGGDAATAKDIVAPVPARLAKLEPVERAIALAKLARVHARLGDARASESFEAKAIAEKQDEAGVWSSLAVAHALREDLDGAVAMIRVHRESAGEVAYALVEAGMLHAAQLVLDEMGGQNRDEAIAKIVHLEVQMGHLEAARTRSLAAPKFGKESPGLDDVFRGYALTGDIAALRSLAAQNTGALKDITKDTYVALAARVLARQRQCDDAIAAAKEVALHSAELFAVIARYCPHTRL